MKKNEEKWGMEKRNHRIPGGGGGGGFPGCDARVIVVILELICQQEALDSSWIRPSVCDLAAEAENTHTHTWSLCGCENPTLSARGHLPACTGRAGNSRIHTNVPADRKHLLHGPV